MEHRPSYQVSLPKTHAIPVATNRTTRSCFNKLVIVDRNPQEGEGPESKT